ncbi:MAG: cyclic nucleotide-binding domain-containing protein [Elusimicrobia bacterium]|nr:cyclic nucleotide-binding domain-containing protein [Elusimicrobiota bacterium]
MDALTFLRERVPLFAGVNEENLAALAESSVELSFRAGQTILFKGATVDGLHLVVSGKAGVYVKSTNKTMVRVAELGAGEVFGEMSIVEMGTAGAAIKAESDAQVLMIPQESFRHVLQQDEGFAVRVNILIVSRRSAPVSIPA